MWKIQVQADQDKTCLVEIEPDALIRALRVKAENKLGLGVLRLYIKFDADSVNLEDTDEVRNVLNKESVVFATKVTSSANQTVTALLNSLRRRNASGNQNARPKPDQFRLAAQDAIAQCEANPLVAELLRDKVSQEYENAVKNKDVDRAAQALQNFHEARIEKTRKAFSDELSLEAQELAFEAIKQKRLDQNMTNARDVIPESFTSVTMLYIMLEINENPIKALVDSGAQATIISEKVAEKCGLIREIDSRFASVAQGVGHSRILGRIHLVDVKMGGVFFPASLQVIENLGNIDLLFGLDLLRRYQCRIDLLKNCLAIGEGLEVPFLTESELQQNISETTSSPALPKETKKENDNRNQLDQNSIVELTKLGFPLNDAKVALTVAEGDVNRAADLLFQGLASHSPN